MKPVFLYLASGMLLFWGVAHLVPTRSVVRGFGEISSDNKKIISMEWIGEGLTLIFLGILILSVTVLGDGGVLAITIYLLCFIMLIALSLVSLFTGFRINYLPFRLCPLIFTLSALFILLGLYI